MSFKTKISLVLLFTVFVAITSCNKRIYQPDPEIYGIEDNTNTSKDPSKKPKSDVIVKDEFHIIDSIIIFAIKYVGTPYKYGGTTPSGFDCSGFVQFVFKSNGITIPRMPADMAKMSTRVDFKDIRPGDIVYFKGSNANSSEIGHVALVIERNGDNFKMIHATSSKGVIINDYNQYDYWKTRYLFASRFKKETILNK